MCVFCYNHPLFQFNWSLRGLTKARRILVTGITKPCTGRGGGAGVGKGGLGKPPPGK